MIIPAICFLVGAAAMGRTKPTTRAHKILCLGPRTGIVYNVEDFREIGTLIVRAPQKSAVAQFIRVNVREPGKPGLVYQHGFGDPRMLELIRKDFGMLLAKPKAVAAEEKKAK